MPRAPKHCGRDGCLTIVASGTRCDQHRHGWQHRTASSTRTATAGWKLQRARALQRDGHMCVIRGPRCTVTATEVDHRLPVSLGGTDDLTNLQSTCKPCHDRKTATEAAAARGYWQRAAVKS